MLAQIQSLPLPTSFGSKVDALARHLLWLRQREPGAKSLVFSQYGEFLDLLAAAFARSNIGSIRLGKHKHAAERFKEEPALDCLLMDARTNASGLTLVNATHVFIAEPILHREIESQAIGALLPSAPPHPRPD